MMKISTDKKIKMILSGEAYVSIEARLKMYQYFYIVGQNVQIKITNDSIWDKLVAAQLEHDLNK